MTYMDLYYQATNAYNCGKITASEYKEAIKPLNDEVVSEKAKEEERREAYAEGYQKCISDILDDLLENKEKLPKKTVPLIIDNLIALQKVKEFKFDEWIEEVITGEDYDGLRSGPDLS